MLKYPYVGEYRKSEFKFGFGIDNSPNQYNNPMGYELGNELAQTHSLIYKREMTLTLVYNYKVNNVGLRENDRRVLKRIT